MIIQITHSNDYDIATRNIKVGDKFKVEKIGESKYANKGCCYLFTAKIIEINEEIKTKRNENRI